MQCIVLNRFVVFVGVLYGTGLTDIAWDCLGLYCIVLRWIELYCIVLYGVVLHNRVW